MNNLTLLSDNSHYSHAVRFAIAEKGIKVKVVELDPDNLPDAVKNITPYGDLPVWVDRGLSLYEPGVILEYLDERYPSPPLLPGQPIQQAYVRMWLFRFKREWYECVGLLCAGNGTENTRRELKESIESIAPIFEERRYFMSDELTLSDICLATILWRLNSMGILINSSPLSSYMNRIFNRESFHNSLNEYEKQLN